ncbi:glycosyltransferase family 4 protein [Arthrobacter sp. STN4]|uniref:glycosyltransferase family 4 protein n=1 Tax=Arthrobacter sp. STN4 TaxID=2923276 RepID=UPI002119EC02|nr:glycosyltransferase family 4 protein [Arthrobacter sp. STN4]MCQ9163662.1 glycosyltransferase family 4 protein [Arthrobacter sp. STN4]
MASSKLRITILGLNYLPEPTGIAPYTTRLAELLAADGHDVSVLTGYPHYPEWKLADGFGGWSRRETINGVQVHRLRHFIPRRVSNLQRMHLELSFGFRLLFAKWDSPDAVLIVSPALFAAAIAIVRARFGWRKPPTGIWVQDIYSRGLEETGGAGALSGKLMKIVEAFVLRSATKVTVIHDRFGDYLESALGVPRGAISTIRNWTHLPQIVSIDRNVSRRRFGWADDEVIVLHAGNIGVKQGLGNVVEAARLADLRESSVRFVLLGDGNQKATVMQQAEGIKHIQFIDPLPDAWFQEALQSADILLVNELSGLREMAVPSKLTSYFASGLPVIAATEPDSTTAGEITASGAGIRVDPSAPEDLLRAAERLSDDPPQCASLGAAGRDYAKNKLSEHAAIVEYSAWLTKLAAAKRATTARTGRQSHSHNV